MGKKDDSGIIWNTLNLIPNTPEYSSLSRILILIPNTQPYPEYSRILILIPNTQPYPQYSTLSSIVILIPNMAEEKVVATTRRP